MKVDPASNIPLYQQIADGIRAEILSGRRREGEQIPSVRELASALRINPNTVAKAYRMLQEEGVIESRPGGGNYIAKRDASAVRSERAARLDAEIISFLAQTDSCGIPRTDVLKRLMEIIDNRKDS
ncbi:MAG: HTH-type transcriptional repressor YtrA [Lentisphaerae bacterium ADurb.Bin242]|nr:MAG: HTH-type transcriptional repressor YtrA [Lentisphaerae bacterium ADurb.Bin242]